MPKNKSKIIIEKFDDWDNWLSARVGCISGSKVKDLIVRRGTAEKQEFYQLIADKLATIPDGENAMDRGARLEGEALELFEEKTKIKLVKDLVIWRCADEPRLMISPDAYTKDLKTACEIKCLASSRHVEALIKQKVPADHEDQIAWYFVINPDLEKLYMAFYDNRMITHSFFYLTIKRTDYKKGELEGLKTAMIEKLRSVDEQVARLTEGTDLSF